MSIENAMRSPFDSAIEADRDYHASYFTKYRLGDEGTWIASPDDFVLRHIECIARDGVVVDIGCGPGRLTLPVLRHLQGGRGRIICIDYLDEALASLQVNVQKIDSGKQIIPIKANLAHMNLAAESIDAAIAWSVWEATFSPEEIEVKLQELRDAVRANGCAFVMFNTNMTCIAAEVESSKMQKTKRGNMSLDNARSMLLRVFHNWEIIEIGEREDSEVVGEGQKRVEWNSIQIMFAARRPRGGPDAVT